MSETQDDEQIGQPDECDDDRQNPSTSCTPEASAGRLEEREQRQHTEQQHGDTFAVDTDQPTDTSGVPTGTTERVRGQTEPSHPERQVTREMLEKEADTGDKSDDESETRTPGMPAKGHEAPGHQRSQEGEPGTGDQG